MIRTILIGVVVFVGVVAGAVSTNLIVDHFRSGRRDNASAQLDQASRRSLQDRLENVATQPVAEQRVVPLHTQFPSCKCRRPEPSSSLR